MKHSLVTLLTLAALSPFAAAQTVTGTMEGRVSDKGGAVVPGSRITARQIETGLQRTVVTNEEGYFKLAFLPLGTYNLRVDHDGFRPVQKNALVVELNRSTVSDFILEPSTVREVVTVTSEAPQIETTSGELKGTIDARTVENTP